MKKRVLVTGGAGFIGSHLVDRLISDGFEVAVLDNLSTGSTEYLNEQALFIKADVADEEAVVRLFNEFRPDYVFHLAAHADVVNSVSHPQFDATVNILGTINVLKAAIEIEAKKFVFTSSAAVYGIPRTSVVSEDSPTVPVSPYGTSKLSAEQYVRVLADSSSGTGFVILRLANVYGPRQGTLAEAGVISIFIKRILQGKEITVYGDGRARRDFIYVSEVVDALLKSIEKGDGVYNISTGKAVSIGDVLEAIEKHTGPAKKIMKPLRPGEIEAIALDNRRAMTVLDWRPVVSLEQGIKQTIEFWRETVNEL